MKDNTRVSLPPDIIWSSW